ncbi:TPA: hypothetical protein DIV45_00105 [Patescibacteria group bacterium]|uniref:Uncharacterized protein n=1 Tax=candidate division Kazan bacterium GW2011_GWB1_45_10 TaxID=1620411 RepID=A0A0G1KUF8_UNCK3|nr:MAG: hypothetical protein VE97_C0002G0010 [candidate division Kazan bacterium GW2011_GWB1_45_10]HCR41769.1 hypothetical protein [Patescibacteria group bacterium]
MTREEALAKDYLYYCLNCNKVYKELPVENYEDGHGGRNLQMCKCGCDLFADLKTDQPVTTGSAMPTHDESTPIDRPVNPVEADILSPHCGENTTHPLRTDDKIIDEWLASIGLTRKDVVIFAGQSRDNTKFAAEHMHKGDIDPTSQLTGKAIDDVLAKEEEKVGFQPRQHLHPSR